MTDHTTTYQQIYNEQNFRAGFGLIETQSDEKQAIARALAQVLSARLEPTRALHVVDVAGGSGAVWQAVAECLPALTAERLSVTLVDSSEEQIKRAQALAHTLPWLHPHLADSLAYLRTLAPPVEVITALHFLPGLPHDLQKETIALAQQALPTGGVFFVVQPKPGNPLSVAKSVLRQALKNQDYVPRYVLAEYIGPDWERATVMCTLRVAPAQLLALANFLAETQYTPASVTPETFEIVVQTFQQIATSHSADTYVIGLLNEYLLWSKR